MSGTALSENFPTELMGKYAVRIKNDRRSSSSGLTPVRGKAQLESSLLFDDQHPLLVADSIRPEQGNLEKKMCFDPTVTKAFFRKTPAKLPLIEDLNMYHIDEMRHRLHQAFENRHRKIMEKNNKSFFRSKGAFEAFIDKGVKQIDMLPAWLPLQSRRMSLTHALKIVRPKAEFYFDKYNQPHSSLQEFGNTERLATSQVIRQHHIDRRNKLAGHPNNDVPFCKTFVAPRKSLVPDADLSQDEILNFERKHHRESDLKTMTKQELKMVIEAEGEEVPGSTYWDSKSSTTRKRNLPKADYLASAQEALLKNEAKPVFQRGKTLRQAEADRAPAFCVVSFYRCRDQVVRIEAYDQEKKLTYRLVLTPTLLQDHDIVAPPKSKSLKRWLPWANVVLDMLEITFDNRIAITRLPLQANGLPPGFSLTGENKMFRQVTSTEDKDALDAAAEAAANAPPTPPDSSDGNYGRGDTPLSSKHVAEFFDRY